MLKHKEFEYCFIVAYLMIVQVIVYIVLFFVCCDCVLTFEHLFAVLHVVSHLYSSYCHACHVFCVWFAYVWSHML